MAIDTSRYSLKNLYAKTRELLGNSGPSVGQQKLANTAKGFYQGVQNTVEPLGYSLGTTIRSPFEQHQIKTSLNSQRGREQNYYDLAFKARQQGNATEARRLTGLAQQTTAPSIQRMKLLGQDEGKYSKGQITSSAVKTAFTAGSPYAGKALIPTMAVGGGINSLLAKYNGQDASTAFGYGAAQAMPWATVNKLTEPVFQGAMGLAKVKGLARIPVKGGLYGVGNVLEDQAFTRAFENRAPTKAEMAISFGAGLGYGAGSETFQQLGALGKAKSRIGSPSTNKSLRQQLELIASDQPRAKGKYAQNDELRSAARIVLQDKSLPKNSTPKFVKLVNDIRFQLKNSELGELVQDPADPNHFMRQKVEGFIDPSAKIGGKSKLKIKPGETIGEFQLRTQKAAGKSLLTDFDIAQKSGDQKAIKTIAQQIVDSQDPAYATVKDSFRRYLDSDQLNLLKKARDAGDLTAETAITDRIRTGVKNGQPAGQSLLQISEEGGGWKPGQEQAFNTAIFKKDATALNKLLPDVPEAYKNTFTKEIEAITGTPEFVFKTDRGDTVVQTIKTPSGQTIKVKSTPSLTTENVPLTTKQAIGTGGTATIPTEPMNTSMVGKQGDTSYNPAQAKSSKGVLGYLKKKLYPASTLPKDIEQSAIKWDADNKVVQVKANQINDPLKKIAKNLKLSDTDQWELIKYAEIKDPVSAQQYAKSRGIEELVKRSEPLVESYRSFNDDLYKRAQLAGFDVNYIQNHILHKYKQTPEEIQALIDGLPPEQQAKIMGAGLGQKPGFSKKRYIDSYAMAEAIGVEPRYRTFGQIAAEMEAQLGRAKANRNFMESLDKAGVISPFGSAPADYVPLKATGIPKTSDGRPYAASPDVAPFLETVFGGQEALKPLKAVADLSSTAQDISLVSPGYTVNAFTIGQAVKDITGGIGDIATLKPKQGMAKIGGALRAFIPEGDFDVKHADSIEAMARNNIGYSGSNRFQGDQSAFPKKTWNKVFNDPTFQKFMNQRRVRLFETFLDSTGDEKLAADILKNYDGVQFDLGRDKNAEAGLRAILFAPRYREGVIGTFTNAAKGVTTEIKNPAFQSSRSLLAGMVLTYLGINAINQKFNDGKNMWENPPGKEMELVIPKRVFDQSASDDEFWSIPYMPGFMATPRRFAGTGFALLKGDTNEAISQFSGLMAKPVSAVGQALSNKDYFGRESVDDTNGVPALAQQAGYVGGQMFSPGFIREPWKYAQGKQSGATTLLRTMELPLKEGKFSNKFWNDYNNLKKYSETLDELKYKNPTKALSYYQEHKDKIDQFQMMKPTAKQYGIDKEAGRISTAPSDYMKSLVPQAQASNGSTALQDPEVINMRIQLNDPSLTGDEIASYYLRDLNMGSTGSKYQDSINEDKIWSRLSDIENRDTLTDDQRAKTLASFLDKSGIDTNDYQYYSVAKQENDLKTMYAIEELTKIMSSPGATKNDVLEWLKQNRYEYRGKMVLAPGVIDNLVDENILSYAEGKELKKYTFEKDGVTKQLKPKSSKKGTKAKKPKKIKLKAIKVPKVKVVANSGRVYKAPKIKAVDIRLKIKK